MSAPHELGPLSPHDPGFPEQRDALFARLRSGHPVARSSAHGGYCLVTRYADVRAVLEDHDAFSSAHPGRVSVPPTVDGREPLAPIEFDPPRQVAQVGLVAPWFSARRTAGLEPALVDVVERLVGPLVGTAEVEVVEQVALPLVSQALAVHLQLPLADADRWVEWARRVFATRVDRPDLAEQARQELHAYVAALLLDRRARPRDDVLTAVATGLVEGAPLPEDEAVGFGVNLLLAGRDALVDAVGSTVVHLAEHPADLAALRADPARLPRAVEELLRAYAPITVLGRVTTRDVVVAGVALPADTTVGVVFGSANRDERVFPDAARVDLDRRGNRHLAFGAGTHRCPGAPLARLVLTVLLRRLVALDVALVRGRPLVAKPNGDTRGWTAVHARLGAP